MLRTDARLPAQDHRRNAPVRDVPDNLDDQTPNPPSSVAPQRLRAAQRSPAGSSWNLMLRALREAAGLTQDGWAGLLEVSRSSVQRWERGVAAPDAHAEAALCHLCRERGLFRRYRIGPLAGADVDADWLSELLAVARITPEIVAQSAALYPSSPALHRSAPPRSAAPPWSPWRPSGEKGDEGGEAPTASHSPVDRRAFVGREQELRQLQAACDVALSGEGALLIVAGEPGIGKTRLAQELARYATRRRAQVLWGRCAQDAGAPPYWPWVQIIRAYAGGRDSERLRMEMGAGAADIAEIVSEVRARLPDLAPSPKLEPEQARFRLFDSITLFLKHASRAQPLVLILEDLHWADRPSLLLLEFLARELAGSRLLVLMTFRDLEVARQDPLSLSLGELNRERMLERVPLRGLSREDVAQFIELAIGAPSPAGLAEAVYTRTEGNPLFVTEVVRLLAQEGRLAGSPASADTAQLEGTPSTPAGETPNTV